MIDPSAGALPFAPGARAAAVCTAYNDWLAEYCAPYPERLKGIAVVPWQDPQAARKEMRRAVERKGMVGVVALSNFGGHLLHEPQFDPLWQTRDPRDWIKSDNVYFSVAPEESTIAYVAQTIGEERLMYASDYSHWDWQCPDSVKLLNEQADLGEGFKRKLFGENAARLFRL